jgi:hypothetical protein
MRGALALCVVLGLCGCVTTGSQHAEATMPRLYPVCYFDSMPASEVVQANLPRLRDVLQTSFAARQPVNISVSPDGRWLVANVTEVQNQAAANVWPRVGCIGNVNDSRSAKKEAD